MVVAVVTDATCDLSADDVARLGVRVVPLGVTVEVDGGGDRTGPEGIAAFYEALAGGTSVPTTSQPAGPAFLEVWREAAAGGADEIVSLHVAGALSGTVDRARATASRAPVPVTVIDSEQVSGGLALQVVTAARVAAGGAPRDRVVAAAEQVRASTTSLVGVDDPRHLRRGGRFRGAGGDGLTIRPVLALGAGGLEPVALARTWRRAIDAIVTTAAEAVAGVPVEVVLTHALVPDRVARLRAALESRLEVVSERTLLMGPVVGAHVGPGAVGVALVPAVSTGVR